MTAKNKFGFEPMGEEEIENTRRRSIGPMGAAVREAAESLQGSTEIKVEQRRQNAADAKEYRAATEEGRVLVQLPLEEVRIDGLPRDRLELEAVADSEGMEELMASIAARGQREPIEVFRDSGGHYQLIKGWRRLTALRQLLETTGGKEFTKVVARVSIADEDRIGLYVDMVEENVVREDLTFAEMAQLAITATDDPLLSLESSDAAVGRLYASLHKMKRSYVRSFVFLLESLGASLKWPKAVPRNLGVDVARKLKGSQGFEETLISVLEQCKTESEQNEVLVQFANEAVKSSAAKAKAQPKEKFEFHVGASKVTARNGELRIVAKLDYTGVPRNVLEEAVLAFQSALKSG
jgi:ParB family chromosome partitioning protein